MKRNILMAFVLILSITLFSCNQRSKKDSSPDTSSSRDTLRRIASPVETADAKVMDMRSILRATGSLEPYQNVRVLSKVQGIPKEIFFEKGDHVKKGDILLELDKAEYEIALKQAEADLASAKASLNEAELQRAENQYNRIKEMYEKNLSSQQELEQHRSGYLQAKSNYDSQQARILSFKANYERAKLNLSYTTIRSPMDGVINNRNVRIGELVSPSTMVFDIVDISKLYANIYISERFIHYLDRGKPVEVRVDAIPNKLFEGSIDIISPVAEAQSRTFQTSILIDNKNGLLRAGLFTRVVINIAEFTDTIAVPKDAVIVRQEQEYCFIVKKEAPDDDNEDDEDIYYASLTRVHIGVEDARYIQIIEGIQKGDSVIISGHYELNDGDRIRIIRYID